MPLSLPGAVYENLGALQHAFRADYAAGAEGVRSDKMIAGFLALAAEIAVQLSGRALHGLLSLVPPPSFL